MGDHIWLTARSHLSGIQSQGRQATLKHLVCNDSETSRREYDVQVDERVLREVYLRPFEIAVEESNPSSIMAAYNNVVRVARVRSERCRARTHACRVNF